MELHHHLNSLRHSPSISLSNLLPSTGVPNTLLGGHSLHPVNLADPSLSLLPPHLPKTSMEAPRLLPPLLLASMEDLRLLPPLLLASMEVPLLHPPLASMEDPRLPQPLPNLPLDST